MMKYARRTCFMILIIGLLGCGGNVPQEDQALGPFLGMESTEVPKLLAPGIMASPLTEYNGTFSPDGKEFFYTCGAPGMSVIATTRMLEGGSWTSPAVANFSGKYIEYDPLFTPDGNRLYFSSTRPTDPGGPTNVTNSWYVDRTENGWSEPQFVKLTGQGDYYNSTTYEGDMYFNVWSNGKVYKASKQDTGYSFEEVPLRIDSDAGDPFISPDEEYIIFRGYGSDGLGAGDMYIAFRRDTGWTDPINLGEPINSPAHEMCPYVTTDGKFFIFASSRLTDRYGTTPDAPLQGAVQKSKTYDNGQQNVYYISAGFIRELKQDLFDG